MRPGYSLSGWGKGAKVAFGLALLAIGLFAAFDWNWLRQPAVDYLIKKSNREIRVDDLHVELGLTLEPTIRLRGVYIQNAPWAGDRPFATAGEASFKVSLKSLWEGRPVISRLVLVDADVDMQRQADGLRNWRLKRPDDRSPGRVTVHTLEAHRTTIRFVNREIDLEFMATARPVEKPADGLSSRIAFEGKYEGVPYSGTAFIAGVMSFRGSGITFPLRGHMATRNARIEVDGLFSDIFDVGAFDAKVRLSGSTLSALHPFLRIHPPPSRPFDIDAQLTQVGDVYDFAHITAKIGATDLAGDATYDRSRERPLVRARLVSEAADLDDLRALIGMRSAPGTGRSNRRAESPDRTKEKASRARVLPARPFRVDRLLSFDANIKLDAKHLKSPGLPMFDSLRVTADLAAGLLHVKPMDIGVGGGHIVGALTFDARQTAPSAAVRMSLRDLRLEKLVPALAANARSVGAMRGEVNLTGKGNSIAEILGNASGSLDTAMKGGRISNLADAKLGLNFGKMISVMLRGDRDIAIRCGVLAVEFRGGIGKSRTVVLDTEQTYTAGMGSLNLRDERWELVLSPQPKKPGLLTRDASIRVRGSFRDAQASLEERIAIVAANNAPSAGDHACSASR
jgi:uncharacterized protein involved in outer membrane biogenesis